jgi:hypothetical protein
MQKFVPLFIDVRSRSEGMDNKKKPQIRTIYDMLCFSRVWNKKIKEPGSPSHNLAHG